MPLLHMHAVAASMEEGQVFIFCMEPRKRLLVKHVCLWLYTPTKVSAWDAHARYNNNNYYTFGNKGW